MSTEINTSDAENSREWPSWREWLVYVLLALLPQAILWLNLFEFAWVYPSGDLAQTYWNHWWFDQAISEFRNPYYCPLLFHPYGAYLYMTTFEVIDAAVTWPIRAIAGPVVSIKAAVLLHALWTSATTHALMRRLGLGRFAAMLCAIVFTHCSYRYINVKAVSLLSTGHPIFLLWALAGVVKRPGRPQDAVALGAGVILCVFSMLYYLMFMTLLIPAAAAFAWFFGGWRPSREWMLGFGKSCGIAALVFLGPLAFFYLGTGKAHGHLQMMDEFPTSTRIRGSADLIQLILPVKLRALLTGHPYPLDAYQLIALPARSFSYALPATVIVGAFAGWLLRKRNGLDNNGNSFLKKPLVAAALGMAVMGFLIALGPELKVWTTRDPAEVVGWDKPHPPEWQGVSVTSPGALIFHLPLWRHVRAPGRAGLFWMLPLLALTAPLFVTAVRALTNRVGKLLPGYTPLVPAAAILMVFLELFQGFYLTEPATAHPIYEELAEKSGEGAVREFPDIGFFLNGMMMYGQTIHEKPLAAGYLSRDLEGYEFWLNERPWVAAFRGFMFQGSTLRLPENERQAILRSAAEDGVQYILWNPEIISRATWEDVRVFMENNQFGRMIQGSDEQTLGWELFTPNPSPEEP